MGASPGGVGDRDHVGDGDGAPPRGAHPPGEKVGEDREARRGEPAPGEVEQREETGHPRARRAAARRVSNAASPALPSVSSLACAARYRWTAARTFSISSGASITVRLRPWWE